MTARQHLASVHERMASHHIAMAKSHKKMAACYSKAEMDSAGDLAATHEEMASQHTDAAEFHLQCCKTLSASNKAMGIGDDDLNRIVPDGISAVYRTDNNNLRAVPRAGSPNVERSMVPREFQKMVSVEDD